MPLGDLTNYEMLFRMKHHGWNWLPFLAPSKRPDTFEYNLSGELADLQWYGGFCKHYLVALISAQESPDACRLRGYHGIQHIAEVGYYAKIVITLARAPRAPQLEDGDDGLEPDGGRRR